MKRVKPKTKAELIELIEKGGNLSYIDTSLITDFSLLFYKKNPEGIQNWDTSNVENFNLCFYMSDYNDNLNWNTSKGKTFVRMFKLSSFNKNIENWDMSSAIDISYMFYKSKFEKNINNLKFPKLLKAKGVFLETEYPFGIKDLNLDFFCDIEDIFEDSFDKLNDFQKFMFNRKKYKIVGEKINKNIFETNSDILWYFDKTENTYNILRKYDYLKLRYELNLSDDILNKITASPYLPNFVKKTDDYYAFEKLDIDFKAEITEEELEPLVEQINSDWKFPLSELIIPNKYEPFNFVKDKKGNIFVKDIDFVFYDSLNQSIIV